MASSAAPLEDARAIALFIDMLAADKGLSARTRAAYASDLSLASRALERNLSRANTQALHALQETWSRQALSNQTISRKISVIRQFFHFLADEGWRADDPGARLDSPLPARKLPRTLNHDLVDRLFAVLDAREARRSLPADLRLRVLMELLYGSGLRASELVGLRLGDLPPGQPYAVITGKGSKQRLVPLSSRALAAIAQYRPTVAADQPFLFPSRGGSGHLTRIRLFQLLRELGLEAGIAPAQLSPHVLRHAFATHMLDNGADLRTLQTLLGHADIATTQIYTHVTSDRLRDAVLTRHPLASLKKN